MNEANIQSNYITILTNSIHKMGAINNNRWVIKISGIVKGEGVVSSLLVYGFPLMVEECQAPKIMKN